MAHLSKLTGIQSLTLLLLLTFSPYAVTSTFKDRMLEKPSIDHPTDQFIYIFFQGGNDKDPYGFVTDGSMSIDDWRSVINHNGFLNPYSIFKPGARQQWKNHGMDKAVIAAQSLGRATGGSILGRPKTPAERMNVYSAYQSRIGMEMTHFFHDDEEDIGMPGGDGDWRIRISANNDGAHYQTRKSHWFDTSMDQFEDGLELSLGIFVGKHVFGGSHQIMGCRNGWQLTFHNIGGSRGLNKYIFHTGTGDKAESPSFKYDQAKRWHNIKISITSTGDPDCLDLIFTVDQIGEKLTKIKPPSCKSKKLFIGAPNGISRDIYLDDISLLISAPNDKDVLAHYTFEKPANTNKSTHDDTPPQIVLDQSGKSHHLVAVNNDSHALRIKRTTGDDKNVLGDLKQDLVDAIIDLRIRSGKPVPSLITNWRLSDRPGRFAYASQYGFTNSSTEYYHYPHPDRKDAADKLTRIFRTRTPRTLSAHHEGSNWNHAWIGIVGRTESILTLDEWQSLLVLAVLDGNRWFSVFTSMSGGHLYRNASSRASKAKYNADVLYKLSKVASWFQPYSKTLQDSSPAFVDDVITDHTEGTVRIRKNKDTKEMWFAGISPPDGPHKNKSTQSIELPYESGIVTNMATGSSSTVSGGVYELPLTPVAEPYHFMPSN